MNRQLNDRNGPHMPRQRNNILPNNNYENNNCVFYNQHSTNNGNNNINAVISNGGGDKLRGVPVKEPGGGGAPSLHPVRHDYWAKRYVFLH